MKKTEKLLTWTTNASRPNLVHLFHHNCNISFSILFETCTSCLLTCKCPWYILSTQSVAALSVTGSSFYTSSRLVWGAQCQTPSVDIRSRTRVFGLEVQKGADRAELSSPRVLKLTLCAHPGYLSALTHTESDAGRHFLFFPGFLILADSWNSPYMKNTNKQK